MSSPKELLRLIKLKFSLTKKILFVGYCGKRPFLGITIMVSLVFIWAIFCMSYIFMETDYVPLSSLDHNTYGFEKIEYKNSRHNGGWFIDFRGDGGKKYSYHTYLSEDKAKKFPVHPGQKITVYFRKEYMTFLPPFRIPLRESVVAVTKKDKFIINKHETKKEIISDHRVYSRLCFFSIFIFISLFVYIYGAGKKNLKRRGLL